MFAIDRRRGSHFEGKQYAAKDILKKFKWKPIELQSKEGLALLNGTQFMSAYGVYCLLRSYQLASLADFIGVISLEAFDGRPEPFDKLVHKVRPHQGQSDVAENIRNILKGSQLIKRKKNTYRILIPSVASRRFTVLPATRSIMSRIFC